MNAKNMSKTQTPAWSALRLKSEMVASETLAFLAEILANPDLGGLYDLAETAGKAMRELHGCLSLLACFESLGMRSDAERISKMWMIFSTANTVPAIGVRDRFCNVLDDCDGNISKITYEMGINPQRRFPQPRQQDRRKECNMCEMSYKERLVLLALQKWETGLTETSLGLVTGLPSEEIQESIIRLANLGRARRLLLEDKTYYVSIFLSSQPVFPDWKEWLGKSAVQCTLSLSKGTRWEPCMTPAELSSSPQLWVEPGTWIQSPALRFCRSNSPCSFSGWRSASASFPWTQHSTSSRRSGSGAMILAKSSSASMTSRRICGNFAGHLGLRPSFTLSAKDGSSAARSTAGLTKRPWTRRLASLCRPLGGRWSGFNHRLPIFHNLPVGAPIDVTATVSLSPGKFVGQTRECR